jgi:hypothetical protein
MCTRVAPWQWWIAMPLNADVRVSPASISASIAMCACAFRCVAPAKVYIQQTQRLAVGHLGDLAQRRCGQAGDAVESPVAAAEPCSSAASTTSAAVAPPDTVAIRAARSTSSRHIRGKSITRPSSTNARPAQSWPLPRAAIGNRCARAYLTASDASAVDLGWTTIAGRRTTAPLDNSTASSYALLPGR